MGFEVNHSKLMQLGMEWAEHLHFDGTNEFLLELSTRAGKPDFEIYERTIFELQGMGYQVIIAHPERYRAHPGGCRGGAQPGEDGLQTAASADFVAGGRMGAERKPAKRLFDENLYAYIASDAHRVEHYGYFAEAKRTYRTRGAHARL